jgi:hypothetical protein
MGRVVPHRDVLLICLLQHRRLLLRRRPAQGGHTVQGQLADVRHLRSREADRNRHHRRVIIALLAG